MDVLSNQNRLAKINTDKTDRSADTPALFLGEKLDLIAEKLDQLISLVTPATEDKPEKEVGVEE